MGNDTTTTVSRENAIVRTSLIGIGANMLLATFKAIVGLAANSIAVILDAVNNLSDALSSVITILGAKYASKKPDKKHPLGHGRAEYLSATIVSALVLYAGFASLIESVIPASTRERPRETFFNTSRGQIPLPWLGSNDALPLATRMTERMGIIKSAAGLGALLTRGIGDTIRVSLTADPVREVYAAFDILKALDMREEGVQFVSCPTCGRTRIDLVGIANEVEERLRGCKKNIKVAVMGCVVNGPGEAKEADIGIAGGEGCGLVFKKGEILYKVDEDKLVDALMDEIEKM